MPNFLICIDASLLIRLVIEESDNHLPMIFKEWSTAGKQLIAPTLLYYEVTNALYQYQKQHILSKATIQQALIASFSLPIRLFGESSLHRAALNIAEKFTLPDTYDAHYLALAEQQGAQFWSADRRLVRKVQGQLDWVHLYR